jgi:Response receiver domain
MKQKKIRKCSLEQISALNLRGQVMVEFSEAIPKQAINTYRDFINEVYIKPIRSTIIVDDKFPTLENFLKNELNNKSEGKKLLEIIEACRSNDRNWVVDVHDGSGDFEISDLSTLNQSDLMILDYHLESDDTGGEKAIKVLKSLASNSYFNMVVIYTDCKDSNSEIPLRVLEIVEGLTFNSNNEQSDDSVPSELTDWEEVVSDIEKVLKNNFTQHDFIKLAQCKDTLGFKSSLSSKLQELLNERCRQVKQHVAIPIINWLYASRLKARTKFLSATDYGVIQFSLEESNWIKTDKLFVTVIPKSVSANEIPSKLLNALEASTISPLELIMAKIRNVLAEHGFEAERKIVENRMLQAYWLKQMLAEKAELRDWRLHQTINHHWDALSLQLNKHVIGLGNRLFNSLDNTDTKEIISKHTGIDISKDNHLSDITFEWNRNVCSKEIDRPYIYTGQIFFIQNKETGNRVDDHYWICLTPACDLIPGQSSSWAGDGLSNTKITPFKAVKLFGRNEAEAIKVATSSEFVFLNLDGTKIKSYSFSESSGSNPSWNQFFAHNDGYINDKKFALSIINVKREDQPQQILAEEYEAVVVTQLRYEYALHWMQKLSHSLSRIGLGFAKHTPIG